MKQFFLITVLCFMSNAFSLKAQVSQQGKSVLSVMVKVVRATNNSLSFQLINTVKTQGYIKPNSPGLFTGTEWEVRFTDSEGKLLQLNTVDDPTRTVVECMNDEGRYQQIALSNADGVIWLRTNYTTGIKYLAIYKDDKLLQKFQLQ